MPGSLADAIRTIGQDARAAVGVADVTHFRHLKRLARGAEVCGRGLLQFAPGPLGWTVGTTALAFSLSLESQLNHSVMHGVYAGLPTAEDLTPERYESLALPFRARTWGDAHRIHHALPSLVGQDPDTVHPLFRVHPSTRWRPWHRFNTVFGCIFTFECWAFDYDRFLKRVGKRPRTDHGELGKFALYCAYQHVLFPWLAGSHWRAVFLGGLIASVLRNFVFVALQTGSSVGAGVSTRHALAFGRKDREEWIRFQVETSKNFRLRSRAWRALFGGLDRHIEHHLFPALPPNRFHALSPEVAALCREHGIVYEEHASLWASLRDSFGYLHRLSGQQTPPKDHAAAS